MLHERAGLWRGLFSSSRLSRLPRRDRPTRRPPPVRRWSNPTTTAVLRAAVDARNADARACAPASGRWQPEGPDGPALEIDAFGEVGRTLTVPAPLIRVVEGTEIALSIRNDLDATLTVHGLCTRGGTLCPPLEVPPGETREVRFASGPAGTYHYWASTIGAPVPFRELAGAFVVDRPAAPVEPDRILVITEWTNLTATADSARSSRPTWPPRSSSRLKPRLTFVINGLSWPATERFTYRARPAACAGA